MEGIMKILTDKELVVITDKMIEIWRKDGHVK